jgi:hypothetical protein
MNILKILGILYTCSLFFGLKFTSDGLGNYYVKHYPRTYLISMLTRGAISFCLTIFLGIIIYNLEKKIKKAQEAKKQIKKKS